MNIKNIKNKIQLENFNFLYENCKSLINKDKERYLNDIEYQNNLCQKYIEKHFKNLSNLLTQINNERNYEKLNEFSLNFVKTDINLFYGLEKIKSK